MTTAARPHSIALAVALAIAVLLLAPFPAPSITPGWTFSLPLDKAVHFLLFLVAARPWRRSLSALGLTSPGPATWILATVYAGLIELLQAVLTSSRLAEPADLLAGSLGALAGVLAGSRGRRR